MLGRCVRSALFVISALTVLAGGLASAQTVTDTCSVTKKGSRQIVCQSSNSNSPEACAYLLFKMVLAQKGYTDLLISNLVAPPDWETKGIPFTAIEAHGGAAFQGTMAIEVTEIYKKSAGFISTKVLGLQCSLAKCSDNGVLMELVDMESNSSVLKIPAPLCTN